ncbi:MAG: cellulase family glycosylhydrolase [Bacteroidota bacterium]|nr:cellulase family glycosylhydrolase [Bacteroidota bacterium]MDP4247163.1 cellulase family glycosylhydrolase [Bacteroidota bacterium]MDP4253079.1 cellulase family glycosylhydrolase [Bacteroidota bacterium]MDP4259816.1 cellulase family glycosylhydrolase [Bacteroidota bacterium]
MIKSISAMGFVLWMSLAGMAQEAPGKAASAGDAHSAGNIFSIADFGAKGDGLTLNTRAIQQTLDYCFHHGGGRVVIPPGRWVTGTVKLYSHTDLHLEPGAILSGSRDDKDYGRQKDYGFSGPGAGSKTGILVAHGQTDISLTGSGIIDGNGDQFMYLDSLQRATDYKPENTRQGNDYMNPAYGRQDGPVLWKGSYEDRPGVMVIFSSCTGVTVSNVRLMHSPNWTMAFLNSEDVRISGITIANNMSIPNSDGVDLYDSRHVTISDCVIEAGDDAIAVISSSQVTATNCVLHSRSAGIRVGYNVFNNNNSGDLLFDNISIYDSNRGIGIFQRQKGNMENMIFSNIVIHTRLHTGGWWGHGEPIHISSIPGLGSKETGSISHVHFSHIVAESESGIVVYATGKGLIRDLHFEDVDLTIKAGPLTSSYGGNIDLRPANDPALAIFKHDLPALYAEFADRLTVDHFHVHWEKGLPAWFRHPVDCIHCEASDIRNLSEEGNSDELFQRFPRKSAKAAQLSKVSVYRNKFVNAKGDTVLFRGVSVADPDKLDHQGHFNRALFEKVKEMGANLVRIPVHPAAWRDRTPVKYLAMLDSVVDWCTDLGMYVIIDWHSIGNLQMELFQDPMYNTSKKETYEFWRTIARHFNGHNTVAFYELFNEPTTFRGQLGSVSWSEWKKINEDIISLVRSFGQAPIPLCAGFDWAYDLTPLRLNPIDAEGIAYVTHPYPNKRPVPWEPRWEEDFGFAAASYPMVATEIGFSVRSGQPADGENDYGDHITKYLEGRGISWVAWCFDPEWGPQLLRSWDGFTLSGSGEYFKSAMHAPTR